MKNSPFFSQAELMLRILPLLREEDNLAIKGGTALNFFILNMPRLSVDIDLVYLPTAPRDEALRDISRALGSLSDRIKRTLSDSKTAPVKASGRISKLFVSRKDAQIKIEPNEVIRGSVFPSEERTLVKSAQELFEMSVDVKSLSVADLYGGKLCAALDRQHPRDFFDIKLLLENEGITDDIRKAFVIYLSSHNRPMNELLNPRWQNTKLLYENEFQGIAAIDVTCDELMAVRDVFLKNLLDSLTEREKQFLLSIKKGEPDWDLINVKGVEKLPAIQWKVENVRRMSKKKHDNELERLKIILNH